MSERRILFICHNHPALQAGGSEIFALDLFRAIKGRAGIRGLFLAATGEAQRPLRPGTLFQTVGRAADEMLVWTGPFDLFNLSLAAPEVVMPELERLLREFKPDIVHFHHYLSIGLETIALARRCLPDARLVMTLHDYYPICAQDGEMITASDRRLCSAATPDACRRCLSDRNPEQFVLRRLHVLAHFRLIDRFLAPSRFLAERFVAWGLPTERIEVVANGRPAAAADVDGPAVATGRRPPAFAYFGNLRETKGVLVALDAVRQLVASGDGGFSFDLHGGSEGQDDGFCRRLEDAIAAAAPVVRRHGAYPAAAMPALLGAVDWVVVPSIWWENAPLVIIETLLNGRPVICSDIGGMAELVTDDVTGLHFRVGDAASLARVMRRAMGEDGLRDRLARGMSETARAALTIEAAAERHLRVYDRLLAEGAAALSIDRTPTAVAVGRNIAINPLESSSDTRRRGRPRRAG